MRTILLMLTLLGVWMQGCCIQEERVEPPYPSDLSGWEGQKEPNGRLARKFVLKKGQATDNARVQVKVIDLIPGDPCAEPAAFQRQARARIQFVSLSDMKVLCEETFAENGVSTFSSEGCGSSQVGVSELNLLGIFSINVLAINLKEEWVYIGLYGYYK